MSLDSEIIIVSGLPRSGTSLMMQMLHMAGIPVLTDELRTADVDNPLGYFEFERTKKTHDDASWLVEARGQAVKVISQLLYDLPSTEHYRVLFMRREMEEVLDSQEEMLKRLGRTPAPREQIRPAFELHVQKLMDWIQRQSHLELLEVCFNKLIEQPDPEVRRIASFLDGVPEPNQLVQALDPSLYRNRKAVPLSPDRSGK